MRKLCDRTTGELEIRHTLWSVGLRGCWRTMTWCDVVSPVVLKCCQNPCVLMGVLTLPIGKYNLATLGIAPNVHQTKHGIKQARRMGQSSLAVRRSLVGHHLVTKRSVFTNTCMKFASQYSGHFLHILVIQCLLNIHMGNFRLCELCLLNTSKCHFLCLSWS
jgi:hypothetical protein